jgi:hypothetical protein
MAKQKNEYTDSLRRIKSQLLVSTLQRKKDVAVFNVVKKIKLELNWDLRSQLMIDEDVWKYVVKERLYEPKHVFCHPDVLIKKPVASFYYRGLCGLSIKAAKDYLGTIENLESGSSRTKLGTGKALLMAQTYNTFLCSIIKNSTDWTLENGRRTIIATLGITFDGVMRNKVGSIAEERIRLLLVEWLAAKGLVSNPPVTKPIDAETLEKNYVLTNGIAMHFGSDPDVSFEKQGKLLAILEIKGGIDPAGALERYGAAKKSFEHAMQTSPRCKTFYLGGVFTPELKKRMSADRLVENSFSIIDILQQSSYRENFLKELFHHTLRLVE